MKTLINLLLSFSLVFVFSCKTREKQTQKTENQTETKSEATAKIEEKTYEIVSEKELTNNIKTNFVQNNESSKDETKNVEVIREYYENGNLKSEINKTFSQLSEATRTAIAEMREKLSKEKETSQYWEDSSDKYYQLYQEEKQKNYTKNLSVKSEAKKSFLFGLYVAFWYIVFAVFFGWLIMPVIWRFIYSWVKRFQPYIALVEWVKSLLNKNGKKL